MSTLPSTPTVSEDVRPGFATARRPQYVSEKDRLDNERAMEAFRKEFSPPLLDTVSAALQENTVTGTLFRQMFRSGSEPDDTWTLTQKRLDEVKHGIDPELWSFFGEATSDDHLQYIRSQLLGRMEDRKALAAAGYTGKALSIASGIADPLLLIPSLGTGGAATAATQGSRLARLARAGLTVAVPTAAAVGYQASQEPGTGLRDVAQAAAGGFVLGALGPELAGASRIQRLLAVGGTAAAVSGAVDLGVAAIEDNQGENAIAINLAQQFALNGLMAAIPGKHSGPREVRNAADAGRMGQAAARAARDATFRDVRATGTPLTPKGEAYFRESIDPTARVRAAAEPLLRQIADDEAAAAAAPIRPIEAHAVPAQHGMGAATRSTIETPAETKPVHPGDFDPSPIQSAKPSATHLWDRIPISFGMSERLAAMAKDPVLNLAARVFGFDPLPAADGSPSPYSANEWAGDVSDAKINKVEMAIDEGFAKHIEHARSNGQKPMTASDFRAATTLAVRAGAFGSADPGVAHTARAWRDIVKELRDMAERHGVKNFDAFDNQDTYVPRIGDRDAVQAANEAHGHREVMNFIREAIESGLSIRGSQGDPVLFDGATNPTPEQVAEMAGAWWANANTDGQSTSARGSRRIPMNENYAKVMPNGTTLHMADLLVNDMSTLGALYARHIVGASAVSRGLQHVAESLQGFGGDVPKIESFADLKAALLERNKDSRIADNAGENPAVLQRQLDMLEVLIKQVEGTPIVENTPAVRLARLMANLNVLKSMANPATGLLNLAEMGGAVAERGFGATLKQFPALSEILQVARTGKATTALGHELMDMGLGVERAVRRVRKGVHGDEGMALDRLSKLEHLASQGARLSTDLSLQSFGQDAMRFVMGKAMVQAFYDHAVGTTAMSTDRLAASGLTPEMAATISGYLKQHATVNDGRVVSINADKWAGPDGRIDGAAVSAFQGAVTKATKQAVLTPNPAGYAKWMTNPIARLALQFRLFSFASWRGKLLYGLRMSDRATVAGAIGSTMGAAAAYIGSVILNAAGRPDASDYLADRLTPEKVASAAFARASYSSLIPATVDTVMQNMLSRDPVFAHSRSTGLAGSLIEGNPTLDWATSAYRAVGAAQAPFTDDYSFSARDLRNIRNGLFIPNAFGLNQAFQWLDSTLPETSK